MQSSSMMLDSTIAEILTAKQVEPSIQIDAEKEQKRDDDTSSSEAEVRLVVRFIVEEHIVYKGKIEKVHQLENEELSRIVSRVAWDGAKENDNLNTDRDNDVVVEYDSSIEPPKPNQSGFRTNINSSGTTVTNPPVANCAPKENENVDQVQEETTRNTDSSNLEAYIRSSPDSKQDIPENEENSFAQTQEETKIAEFESATNCDNNLKRSSKTIRETNKLSSPVLPQTQQIFTHDLTDNFVIDIVMNNNADYGLSSNPTPESIEDVCVDSQSISDTLNDCVNNVHLECQQEKQLANEKKETVQTVESKTEVGYESTPLDKPGEHNELSDIKENGKDSSLSDELKVHTNNSVENINDQEEKLFPVLLDDSSHEEIVRSTDTACDTNNFITTNVIPKEGPSSSSVKRKTTGQHHNSTGKRIRRTKEPNLNTRTSASKSSENTSAKHHSSTPRLSSTGSLLSNNQQTRKVRVFAKWSDNHFYPGVIVKPAKDRKLVISFLDGAQRNVAETDLIPICNIEGRQVRVSIAEGYCVNAIVHDQRSPVNDQPMFDVEYQQDGLVRKCVPLKDIFLTAEQGTPLINQQVDKNSSAGNFADVDLDNIIYEKRSRRLQEMEEFYFSSTSPHRTKTSLLL